MGDIGEVWKTYDIIGVDEGQFFPDIVKFSEEAANSGKIVIISALDGTFQRTGFPSILELIPLAEKVKKLQAICKKCSQNASFTFRTVQSTEVKLIGGESMYIPLCRECFNQSNANLGEEAETKMGEMALGEEEEVDKENRSANMDERDSIGSVKSE
mmetsp:Transcript_22998/g.17442  ORF Transcript_22998/g.17442 Transcript_22998/m.17442 type:complete len:157 (+) Transcript_22998:255-725(+)|eukprot:CAMPEP_0202957542 /NCGR_PEP_ID=MMETSP1396-20130829/1905_1 /ASSEMBLY_ACC=CAM_ASM_000872 /TAXON_ID= /ORGANISM="Pseudokeronopsis sp., Strain Brazil" /LENGTH=156 /DNA_ID=CAMNT_0049675061 /DNA_START=259 /DNA_END=729 /DNA_ORIENTATION=-